MADCAPPAAASELGPQKWQNSVMTSTANVPGTLILVYTAGLMFVLRHFAGPIAHRLSPVGMLTGGELVVRGFGPRTELPAGGVTRRVLPFERFDLAGSFTGHGPRAPTGPGKSLRTSKRGGPPIA